MNRNQFYEQAMTPLMPDEMAFVIRPSEDNLTDGRAFSAEAYEQVGYQMHDFLMARTVAFMAREGRPPRGLRAEMRLVWDEADSDDDLQAQEMNPWFALTDHGVTPIDGEHRHAFTNFLDAEKRRG